MTKEERQEIYEKWKKTGLLDNMAQGLREANKVTLALLGRDPESYDSESYETKLNDPEFIKQQERCLAMLLENQARYLAKNEL